MINKKNFVKLQIKNGRTVREMEKEFIAAGLGSRALFYRIRQSLGLRVTIKRNLPRDHDTCYFCGDVSTIIHHINMDKNNNLRSNLLHVCRSCHSKIHCLYRKMKVRAPKTTVMQMIYEVFRKNNVPRSTNDVIHDVKKQFKRKIKRTSTAAYLSRWTRENAIKQTSINKNKGSGCLYIVIDFEKLRQIVYDKPNKENSNSNTNNNQKQINNKYKSHKDKETILEERALSIAYNKEWPFK